MSAKKRAKPPKKQSPKKHPVRDYLDGLVWDRTPRIDRWLIDCAGADDTPEVRALAREVLVNAVRRVLRPGCPIRQVPILTCPPGKGKSQALRALAVEDAWYSDDLPLNSERQLMEATAGKWIVELSEPGNNTTRELNKLKLLLSRNVDEARPPYQRTITRVPRQFVIIGTSGSHDFLRDPTSNRRFWPVRLNAFDLDQLRVTRDQLWAEAVVHEATTLPAKATTVQL